MSGLFSRFRKRGVDKPQSPSPVQSVEDINHKTNERKRTPSKESSPALSTDEPPSPQHAVETDSIFKGLKLSAQVANSERSDSPYLQRTQDVERGNEGDRGNGESSFSFLHDKSVVGVSDSESNNGEESSSFSFLNPSPSIEDPQPPAIQSPTTDQSDASKDLADLAPQDPLPRPQATVEEEKTLDVKPASHFKSPGSRTAARQAPPTGANKKKKKKAIRPGQQVHVEEDAPLISPPQTHEGESGLVSTGDDGDLPSISNSHEDSFKVDGDTSQEHGDVPTITEDIIQVEMNDEHQKPVDVEATDGRSSPLDNVSMETNQPDAVVDDDAKHSRSESITMETANAMLESVAVETVDESHALEEVFGNYRIELSGEDSLAALLQSYQSSIRKIRDGDVDNGKESHAHIVDQELASIESLIKQRSEVQKLKSDEAQALAEEDYELAEELSRQLERRELLSEWTVVSKGLGAIKEWMKQCAELSENERDLRKSMRSQLTSLKEEQSQALQEITKQLASLKNKEKMRIQALQDKIDRERGHVALDREHLERSEAKLKEELENRAAQPIAAKLKLEEKLAGVESEIAALEEKLSQLRSERDKLKDDIGSEEVTISSVREELSVEQAQLDKERDVIEARDEKLKRDEEKLEKERNLMVANLMEEEGKRDSIAKVIEVAEAKCTELAGVDETLEELLSQLQPLVVDCQSQLKPSNQVKRLQEQCTGLALEVEGMSGEVLATQTKLTSLTKKVSDDELQLQQITDAKQAAVTGRQFKQAGRLAAESKSLSARLEEERSKVQSTSTLLDKLNKNLSELSEKLETVRQDASVEERKEDEKHIELLGVWSKQLREKSEQVRGTTLEHVLEKWRQLNQLLRESLSTKHGLPLSPEEEDIVTSEKEVDIPMEERTPGVGSEEDGGDDSTKAEVGEEERAKLRERISAIETDLEKAIHEENFDKAGELDEELESVKQLLAQVSS